MLINHAICAYHPKSIISYFCAEKDCLLPLCNQCVPIHSHQSHKNQSPRFEPIGDSIFAVKESLQDQHTGLSTLRQQLMVQGLGLRQRTESLRVQLGKFVESAVNHFARTLQQLAVSKVKQMEGLQRKYQQTCSGMLSSIGQAVKQIQLKLRQLHSDNSMAVLIDYHSELGPELHKLRLEAGKELENGAAKQLEQSMSPEQLQKLTPILLKAVEGDVKGLLKRSQTVFQDQMVKGRDQR